MTKAPVKWCHIGKRWKPRIRIYELAQDILEPVNQLVPGCALINRTSHNHIGCPIISLLENSESYPDHDNVINAAGNKSLTPRLNVADNTISCKRSQSLSWIARSGWTESEKPEMMKKIATETLPE